MNAVTRDDLTAAWHSYKLAAADYFAHIKAHSGPLSHTLACTRLSDGWSTANEP